MNMINLAKAFELATTATTTEAVEEKELSSIAKVVATWSKEGQEKWHKDVEEAKHSFCEDSWEA